MPQQIVRQPDGRLAVFSTASGRVEAWDATPAELVAYLAERGAQRAEREAQQAVSEALSDEHAPSTTWEEALASDREHGGAAHEQVAAQPQGKSDDEQRLDQLQGIYTYDSGFTDAGIHDEVLRAELVAWLRGKDETEFRLMMSRYLREAYLSEEALEQRYGVEDVAQFLRWLSDRMDCDLF